MNTPIPSAPTPDQLECLKQFAALPGFGMLADPGVGKTWTALAACTLFKTQKAMSAALVISPIRPLINAWRQEGAKWIEFTGLTFSLVRGTPAERIAALRAEADVYLINPEAVDWLATDAVASAALRADVCIVDESHKFKNSATDRFKALRRIRKYFRRVYLLTGTFAPERLEDAWAQIWLLDGGARLGRTLTEFRNRFCYAEHIPGVPVPKWHVKAGERDNIIAAIADIVRVVKLPPATIRRNPIYVELPTNIHGQYIKLERDYAVALASGPVQAANAAGLQSKLRQFVNGAVYDHDKVIHETYDGKLQALRDLIEEQNGAPLLIAVAWQHDAKRIRAFLGDDSIPYIGGGINDAEVDRVMGLWNAKKLPVLLVHPQSGGEGLNMQAGGNALCWFGLSWSLKDFIQTNARLRAHLQPNGVTIHFLLARNTVDEHVYNSLGVKDQNQEGFFKALLTYMKGKIHA